MPYTIINHNRFSRLTHQTIDYIQTQFLNCERVRNVEILPDSASEGDLAYNTIDHMFYGYNGNEWKKMIIGELPLTDLEPLLKNISDASRTGRFDLSGISADTIRVLKFPDKDGIIATIADLPATNRGFSPVDDATYDLGNASHKYKDAYLSGNLTVGTVDGVDISAHKHTGFDGSVRIESTDLGVTGGANGNLLQVTDGKLTFVQPSTITGLLGSSGPSGYSGYSGHSGAQGIEGPSGISGFSGYSGRAGMDLTVPTNIFYPTHTDSSNGYYTMSVNDPNDAYLIYETYDAGTYLMYGAVSDIPANPTILPGDYQFSIWFNRSMGSGTVSANVKLLYWTMDPFEVQSEIGSYTISSIPQGTSTQKFNISVAYPVTISENRRLAVQVYVTVPSTNDIRIQSNSGYWFTIITPNYKPGSSGYSGYSGQSGASGISGWSGKSGYSGWSGKSGYSGWSGLSGASGISGPSGHSGYSGYSGLSGYSGFSGLSGHSGINGDSGYSGYSGFSGISGPAGQTGATGSSGYSGKSGHSGYSGYSGFSGITGWSGISGYSGYSGYSGMGFSGYSGYSGASGHSGISGPRGATGAQGSQGDQGVQGSSGYSGFSGYSGQTGTIGPSGPQGAQGPQGVQGLTGTSGYSGWSGYSGYSGRSGYSGQNGASGISGWSGWSGAPGSGTGGGQVPAKFIVVNDSGTYKCYNGTSGTLVSSDSVASTVINYALSNLTSGRAYKEKVYLKGDFTLTSAIAMQSNAILEIEGRLYQQSHANGFMISATSKTNFEVIGGEWNGNQANQDVNGTTIFGSECRGMYFESCTEVLIKDLTIHDTPYDNICCVACTGVIISHVHTYNAGTLANGEGWLGHGIMLPWSNNVLVEFCNIHDCASGGVYAYTEDDSIAQTANNVSYIGNIVQRTSTTGLSISLRGSEDSGNYCNISDNLLIDCGTDGTHPSINMGFDANKISKYCTINNNIMYETGTYECGGGISLSCESTIVSNNEIYNCADGGIGIIGGGYNIISNNRIENTRGSTSSALILLDCSENDIHDNIIRNVPITGIWLLSSSTGSNNNHVHNNTIDGVGEWWIRVSESASTGNVIENNILIGVKTFENSGTSTIVRNNTGYLTEKSGSATITSGASSVVITHGLSSTPTKIQVTGTSSATGSMWITSIGATTFTANVTSAVSTNTTIYWSAVC